jgi:ABC-2 type transport system permease protein
MKIGVILHVINLWCQESTRSRGSAGGLALFILGLFLCATTVGALVCILVLTFGNRAEVAAWSLVSLMLLV